MKGHSDFLGNKGSRHLYLETAAQSLVAAHAVQDFFEPGKIDRLG